MKIGIFSDTWLPNINGVTFSILNQLKALHQDHELYLFVPKTFEDKFEKIPDNVQIFEFSGLIFPPYPGYVMSFPPIRSFKKILRDVKLDFVHTHTPFLQGWYGMFFRRLQNIPIATTFHTHIVEYLGHLVAGLADDLVKDFIGEPVWKLIRLQYNRHNVIITPSTIMKKELEDHGINNVRSVPNPISPLFFEEQTNIKQHAKRFRRKFGIPTHTKLIIYVGRIAFEKRLEVLLEAYKSLKSKDSDLYLAIVGDGPQLGMYKEKAQKMKLIDYVFTGYIHHRQLPGVYQSGDIFVSPSDTETQGLTFIEAMSQNVPVLGVESRGVSDSVKHKYNGFLAKKLDVKEFEYLMKYIFDHPEETKEIIKKGKRTAQLFSYEGYRKRLNSAYSLAIENWQKNI